MAIIYMSVEISAEEDVKNFMLDEGRKKNRHLKESIKAVVLIKGTKL
jgi:hypothetical protein